MYTIPFLPPSFPFPPLPIDEEWPGVFAREERCIKNDGQLGFPFLFPSSFFLYLLMLDRRPGPFPLPSPPLFRPATRRSGTKFLFRPLLFIPSRFPIGIGNATDLPLFHSPPPPLPFLPPFNFENVDLVGKVLSPPLSGSFLSFPFLPLPPPPLSPF